ncbi:ABC transporter permease [Altererythrobacter indicus]|uniref:ABC transporter permease n=1 Tax=Altericroceibacterium indicum TaxID=374177 RepID=A0A845ACV8_9SPHN|nr:ABC transporter permease [Altericroceibacterium indicum]MXP26376.1 ABC transporter permease [Altericroceibacterium indicum]
MSESGTSLGRLSIWQAALVIARRDFTAILFSRAFLFFLLGPLFPLAIGVLAGGIGGNIANSDGPETIAIAMSAQDTAHILAARKNLEPVIARDLPKLESLPASSMEPPFDPVHFLATDKRQFAAVLSGSTEKPVLTATSERLQQWHGVVGLICAAAMSGNSLAIPHVAEQHLASSSLSQKRGRAITAKGAQAIMFLLIMLLAGMVLSNLVEEKGNKIIEILAAAIPIDAVFLGKLFAMLGISVLGITVWGSVAILGIGIAGISPSDIPTPAVGWPVFLLLGTIYFAMGYLLLGSIFLAIGSLASTVREVQTLSMPVTMFQVLVFFLASQASDKAGSALEWLAIIFPLSSPFTMLARAATDGHLWPHIAALAWQITCVAVFIKVGAKLFRQRVMKTGKLSPRKRRFFGAGSLLFRNSSARHR